MLIPEHGTDVPASRPASVKENLTYLSGRTAWTLPSIPGHEGTDGTPRSITGHGLLAFMVFIDIIS